MVEKTRTAKNTSRPSALNNQSSFNTLSVTESNLDITSEQTMNRTAQQHSMIRPQSDLFSGRKFYLLDKDSRAELASLISLHKGQVVDHISKTEYVISKNPVISSLPSNTEHINLRTVSWLRDSVEKDVILQPAFQVKFGILFYLDFQMVILLISLILNMNKVWACRISNQLPRRLWLYAMWNTRSPKCMDSSSSDIIWRKNTT